MISFKPGDIVSRKSYDGDIRFRITDIRQGDGEEIAILKGIAYRIQADAPISDLQACDNGNKIQETVKAGKQSATELQAHGK